MNVYVLKMILNHCASSSLHRHCVLALHCETCYTVRGTVQYRDEGSRTHQDYNTRFSCIAAEDLNGRRDTKTLHEVQDDLLALIADDALIIGHELENDLRALKIVHRRVIDTTMVFPHAMGLPYKRSLRSLSSSILQREIQPGKGHDSYEDRVYAKSKKIHDDYAEIQFY
ncbi:hypothetical protein NQ318_001701 [Aromia moschata]|uniref:Exonuclease domain-containing protein n=1 Tax=Aromia moschata TaxID=1265417 RepID=A0AAV8Y5D7_9CUCU|nr:hypothetical protein NQ318_001701 [Aromia moschata]